LFTWFFALSNFSAELGHRWVFPFQNVLAQRILTDPRSAGILRKLRYAAVTPELLGLAGGFANSGDRAFYTDPALELLPHMDVHQRQILLHALAVFQAVHQPA
jgi:hypothetical protein